MIRTRLLAAAALALASTGRPSLADPPATDAAALERAFVVGDLAALRRGPVETEDELVRALAWIRDAFWRPTPALSHQAVWTEDELVIAHAVWLTTRDDPVGAATPARPDPLAGRPDPMPIVTALVLDRLRREREGRHSTRAEGPLAGVVASADIAYFLDDWVPGAYGGPAVFRERDRAESAAFAAKQRAEATRNAWIAAGSIVALVALALVGGLFLARRPAR